MTVFLRDLILFAAGVCVISRARADDFPATQNLQEIFIGRCYDFRNVINRDRLLDVSTSCKELWQLFVRSFGHQEPCSITMDHFERFIPAAIHPVPRHKAMFWERVKPLVMDYTNGGRKFTSLGDVLLGYLSEDLAYCEQRKYPGYSTSTCPICQPYTGAVQAFWARASKAFAEDVSGRTYVLLNGSDTTMPAYVKDRIMGMISS